MWCCFRSCWTVLSRVMRGRPGCLFQSAGVGTKRILLASELSSMCIICPNRISQHDWNIAMSLVALLASVHHRFGQIGTISCQAAYAGTTGRVHRSYQSINQSKHISIAPYVATNQRRKYVHPSLISPSNLNHTYLKTLNDREGVARMTVPYCMLGSGNV